MRVTTPCPNPDCKVPGGMADGTHKCPDCRKHIHIPCGTETDSIAFILCLPCEAKREKKSQQARQSRKRKAYNSTPRKQNDTQQEQESRKRKAQPSTNDESTPPRRKRRVKRVLPPASTEYNTTSMKTCLRVPDDILRYHDILARFMAFRDKKVYESPHPFPDEELLQKKPKELGKWMALLTYGKTNPIPGDQPMEGRSSSIEYYKKAISFFMPNKLAYWNNQANWGNPTKSTAVNEVVGAVKTKEAHGLGKKTQARRDFQKEEFDQVTDIGCNSKHPDVGYGIVALFLFAFIMIGRLDDCCKLRSNKIRATPRFPEFSLQSILEWSKNIWDERACPYQIIFGAADPDYCFLLAAGVHLETSIYLHGGNQKFVFNFGRKTPKAANGYVAKKLQAILNLEDFQRVMEGLLGTHSTHKFTTTLARSKDGLAPETNFWARWKSEEKKGAQGKYWSVDLPWPDAKTAGLLCVGGPIKYKFKSGTGITTDWILENVVPNIAKYYSCQLAEVLGTAMLWAMWDDNTLKHIPPPIIE
jgi:hypothetical protein